MLELYGMILVILEAPVLNTVYFEGPRFKLLTFLPRPPQPPIPPAQGDHEARKSSNLAIET